MSNDLAGTRLFLLSHVDPLVAVDVTDSVALDPDKAGIVNTVIFGEGVPLAVQPVLRCLLGGALDRAFTNDLFDVIEHARLRLNLSGLQTLRGLNPVLTVAEPPPAHAHRGSGALTGPDAVCDLMMQPLMAFSNLVVIMSNGWENLSLNRENLRKAYYQTNQTSYFYARLENQIRLALGFPDGLADVTRVNTP